MYELDATLAAALGSGAPTLLLRLTALYPDGTVRQVLEVPRQRILSGAVTTELRRDARRTASMSLANTDGTLAPALVDDLFAQGSRMAVELGALADGGALMVPMMSGYITVASATMSPPTVDVTVESHLSACAQEAGVAVLLTQGTPLPDALHTLWDPVLVGIEWDVEGAAGDRTLGADIPVLPSDVRLDVGLRIARDLGCEAFDDRLGRVVVRLRSDPTTQATVATITGIVGLTRSADRPPVNAQPVEATPGEGEPIYVLEEVTDPSSPIYRDRIGLRVAPTIRSDSIPDPDTARATARAWLAGRALAADTLSLDEVAVHPERDESDVVEITEPITATSGRWVIESVSTPLGPGTQSVGARSVLPLFITDEAT